MKRFTFFFLIHLSVITSLHAQVVTRGQWTAAPFPDGIIKLSWSYQGIQKNEKITNAVNGQPLLPPKLLPKDKITVWPENPFQIREKANTLSLQVAGTADTIRCIGFDSMHIRGFRFTFPQEGYWYGGGQRATSLVRNGQRISLFNAPAYGYGEGQDQLNYSVPFILTTAGYGLFFDNPSKGYIDFGKTLPGQIEAAFLSGQLDVYIIPGKTPEEIVRKFFNLTGTQPLPPLWALGNFVSRFGYRSQQQATDVVEKMRADSFPMDAIIIDLFWFGKTIQHTLGNLSWDTDNWPKPEKMISDFAHQNLKTILITEPYILEGTKEYANALPYLATGSDGKPFRLEEFYFGKGGILNLFKKNTQDWFWNIYKKQTNKGVAGWWGDLGEPENHPAGVLYDMTDLGIQRKMSAHEVHNIYGHYWTKTIYENWRKDFPDKRLFFLNRAGYAGSQRYSVFPWTGDVSRSWSGFRAQIPALQSMSLSGIPYAHSDAGGFAMTDRADSELYTRWLQFAAYTPIFRPHGSALGDGLTPEGTISLPSEPAFWDDKTKAIALNTVRGRYKLLPYNYTLAWEQTAFGKPLIRPMVYALANDTNLVLAADQYMWGPALLIAPVLHPAQTTRRIYLPHGIWYSKENNEINMGGSWLEEKVSIEKIPVYVKGGTFLPTWENENMTGTQAFAKESVLTLTWFPGQTTDTSYVYLDNGESPLANLNHGEHRLQKWYSRMEGSSIILLQKNTGSWKSSVQYVHMRIPVNGLNTLLNTKNSHFNILVNGRDYFGGKILADDSGILSLLLPADSDKVITIQIAN